MDYTTKASCRSKNNEHILCKNVKTPSKLGTMQNDNPPETVRLRQLPMHLHLADTTNASCLKSIAYQRQKIWKPVKQMASSNTKPASVASTISRHSSLNSSTRSQDEESYLQKAAVRVGVTEKK